MKFCISRLVVVATFGDMSVTLVNSVMGKVEYSQSLSCRISFLSYFVVIKTIEIVADNFYAYQRLQITASQFSNVLQLDQEESFHFGDRINTTLASMVTYTFTLALVSTKTLKNFQSRKIHVSHEYLIQVLHNHNVFSTEIARLYRF